MAPPHLSRTPLPHETAAYTGDLLDSLRKMARAQGQILLAHLLALAVLEAKSLSHPDEKIAASSEQTREYQDQLTRLPG